MRRIVAAALTVALLPAFPAAVSAAPVEYVRVCDPFGAGWSYIPGTDTCVNADTGQTKRRTPEGVVTDETTQSKRAKEGVALSLAIPKATVTPGHTFALAANVGAFEGQSAIGVGAAFQANDNVTFNGNFGVGLQQHTMGGSAGVNISW